MNSLKIKLMLIGTLLVTFVSAQPPAPPATPIDGGLGILLAGGAVYGLKKLKELRKH
ncbi:MAG: hypothetical protein AAF789_03620 [Bacteroidota bacterium]